MTKGKPITYSPDQLTWIQNHRELPRRDLAQQFNARFDRDVTVDHIKALCTRKGWTTGRTGCFEKGIKPWNTGTKGLTGSNSGSFKKGQQCVNEKFAGHERIDPDGYVCVSINETNPHTGFKRRYVHKHRHLWIQAHGPIPKGHILRCLSDDKTNCDPSNWAMIPRSLSATLRWMNYDQLSPELKPVAMTRARLKYAATQRSKQ